MMLYVHSHNIVIYFIPFPHLLVATQPFHIIYNITLFVDFSILFYYILFEQGVSQSLLLLLLFCVSSNKIPTVFFILLMCCWFWTISTISLTPFPIEFEELPWQMNANGGLNEPNRGSDRIVHQRPGILDYRNGGSQLQILPLILHMRQPFDHRNHAPIGYFRFEWIKIEGTGKLLNLNCRRLHCWF